MFLQITNSAEPRVIGVNNGIYQVEISEKELEKNEMVNNLMTQINLDNFIKNRHKIFGLNLRLSGKLLKKAKITDIMGYTPYFFGFQYLVSQKFVDSLEELNVSKDEYHLIAVDIKGVDENFYLLYVPWIMNTEIMFSESLIYPSFDALSKKKAYFKINNYQEYIELQNKEPFNSFDKIVLNKKHEVKNIISVQGISELFFSNSLIELLLKKEVTSFEVKQKSILEFSN